MQELFHVVILVDVGLRVRQQKVEQKVQLLVLRCHHLVHEPEVHPQNVV